MGQNGPNTPTSPQPRFTTRRDLYLSGCFGQRPSRKLVLVRVFFTRHLAFARLVRPKVGQEKAKNNGFSVRAFGPEGFKVLWFEDGEAKVTRDRSFGDVPNQLGRRSGPDYLGR